MAELSMLDAFKALEDIEDNIEVKPIFKKTNKVVTESIKKPLKENNDVKSFLQNLIVKKGDANNKLGKTFIRPLKDNEELPDGVEFKSKTDTSGIIKYDNKDYYFNLDNNDNLNIEVNEASIGKDFRKSTSKDGTVYKQTYHISKDEYKKVLDKLEQEKPKDFMGNQTYGSYEYMKKVLTDLQGVKKNVIFPNLTSAKYVADVLSLDNFKSDRNVRFIIDEKLVRKDTNRSLKESTTINLNDGDDVIKGKDELTKSEKKADNIEQIVDVDAETVNELKDSYIGNVILQCPVCKTLIYKKPEALEQSEENEEIYNNEEECPHCGSKEGFEMVGQVAKYEAKQDESEETTGAYESESDEDKEEPEEEIDVDEIKLENLNENAFDKLINKYIHNIYENVSEYKTILGFIDDKNKQLVVEGVIKYNSGKATKTKFVFEAVATTKRGNLKLKGLNETFTKARKPFTLIGRLRNSTLYCESFRYNYNVNVLNETKKVKGKTFIRDKN